MDAITAQEAGFENTVATMGTALTEDHVNIIARFTNNAVLAFDADSAGMAAALRSAPVFERAGLNIRIISMPAGEDPDSLLRRGDRSKFSELVESALPVADYRVKLVLSKYDLQTDEGKAAALKEAAGILAEVDSIVERERLIRYLARYHPNFATGTSLAEDHIRAEVARFRSRRARQAQTRAVAPETQPVVRRLSLIEQSERLLLGIIILRDADPNKVFEALPPKEFSGEPARLLAEALSNQFSELGKIDQEDLAIRVAGTAGEKLLTDLLVGLDPEELNHPLDDLIGVIINHKKNEKRKRMRALHQRIAEGLVKRGDEEYEEYYRLVRETSGPWRR
jgi:DNA primase